jgi:hypothetical protein
MRNIQHKDASGRVWFHRRETNDGFPAGTFVWEVKKERQKQ